MVGEAQRTRGEERFYYRCSRRDGSCHQPRLAASRVEATVLRQLSTITLPAGEIENAVAHANDEVRQRIARVKQLFVWGDISEREYKNARESLMRVLEQKTAAGWRPILDDRGLGQERPEKIQATIRAIVERVVPSRAGAYSVTLRPEVRELTPLTKRLTAREAEILRRYLATGSVGGTAHDLHIAQSTVRNALVVIRRKLGVAKTIQIRSLVGLEPEPAS